MKKNLGKKNWMFPMPVLMIGTYGEDETPDVMNAAWGGITLEDEITICIDTSHKTWENIAARKAFTIAFGTADKVAACDYLGLVSGNKTPDKVKKSGLTVTKSKFVDAPVINELPLVLECELVSMNEDRQLRGRGSGAHGRQARRREDEANLLRPLRPRLSHHERCRRNRILRREGACMTDLTEKTLATERKYTGKIISVDLLDIELPDGRKAKREVIRHGNAVAIVARRPDGKFVFVKQYRKAAEEALIEVIAGGLEPGEDPIEGARRETAEETGYEVTSIKFLTTIICTPGYCEERIHLYFAEISDKAHAQDQDPDENVYPVVLSEAEVEDGIRNGTIFDSKTLSAWLCWRLAKQTN